MALLAIAGGAATGTLVGQQRDSGEFERTLVLVLAKNCFSCHSNRQQAGRLSLEALADTDAAFKRPEVWQKVLDKITSGQMPPRPNSPLPADAVAAVSSWIRTLPGIVHVAATAEEADPGRVTARRLNRAEYNNTIRDLLGVTLRPADEFPVDGRHLEDRL